MGGDPSAINFDGQDKLAIALATQTQLFWAKFGVAGVWAVSTSVRAVSGQTLCGQQRSRSFSPVR